MSALARARGPIFYEPAAKQIGCFPMAKSRVGIAISWQFPVAKRPPEAHSWRASRLPLDFFRLAREAVLFAAAAAHAAGSSRSMATDSTGGDGDAAPSIGPALIGSRGCRIGSISQARIFTRAASASRRWRCLGGRWIGGLRWW